MFFVCVRCARVCCARARCFRFRVFVWAGAFAERNEIVGQNLTSKILCSAVDNFGLTLSVCDFSVSEGIEQVNPVELRLFSGGAVFHSERTSS